MINVQNIFKSYDKKQILNDISFEINRGECVSIIGTSGIGKSVLLKSLIGLIEIDHGKIFIDNQLINKLPFKELQKIRSNIGMVFQFGALFDSMSVEENISLALKRILNLSSSEIKDRVEESLSEVGMSGNEKKMPSELSGGMKKRVGIARSIAIRPRYMFYDEPTTGLDPIMTDSINKLISNFHNTHDVTSIIVTHEMKIVNETVNKVFMLYEGNIIFEGSPEELYASTDKYIKYFTTGKEGA